MTVLNFKKKERERKIIVNPHLKVTKTETINESTTAKQPSRKEKQIVILTSKQPR